MVFECYIAYCKQFDFKHYVNGKYVGLITQVLTESDKKLLSFKQTELVQGAVIEAVKHMEGGSSAFKKYFLNGMTDPQNIEIVRKELTTPYDQGGYNMTMDDANRMLYVVQWAKESQMLKGVKNFITKYNKGTLPENTEALDMWEDFVQANTYFGGLVKEVFDIKKNIEEETRAAIARTKDQQALESNTILTVFDNL